jgi:hypothetical protein
MQADAAVLIAELRRLGETALAEKLDRAQYGSTSGEILGDIGAALLQRAGLKAKLSDEARRAWDNLRAEVDRAYPGWSFRSLFTWRKR